MDLKTTLDTFERSKKDIITSKLSIHEGKLNKFSFTEKSFNQFCTRFSLPARYMRRCFDTDVSLFDQNARFWLKEAEERNYLLRTRGYRGTLRAILSDKYSILDNIFIFNNLPDITIKDYYMDEDFFQLRCVFPQKVNSKDPCFLGLNILNSETGHKALTVEICIWRQVCSNGLIIKDESNTLLNQRHLYTSKLNIKQAFIDALEQIQDDNSYLYNFINSRDIAIDDEEIDKRLEGVNAKFIDNVKFSLEEPTLYGLINAITFNAKALPFEQRYEMEKLAGGLLC